MRFIKSNISTLWQALFITLATSWLWAPILNQALSPRITLISQYELPNQPYSWLFRTADVLAALLLLVIAIGFRRHQRPMQFWLLVITGFGLLSDPLLSTSCRISGDVCREYFSTGFLLHAIETVATAAGVFLLSLYDYWQRKRLVSAGFVGFQLLYGLLFLTQLAEQDKFNTVSQYIYQLVIFGWLAWFVRETVLDRPAAQPPRGTGLVRALIGYWAFLNGALAIFVSFAHLRLIGHLNGLYFTRDNAWLAQHGIAVGLVTVYLSRHLYRGERRARQLFVLLMGIETVKYSVVSPNPALLTLYFLSMLVLFVLRDDFDRGTEALTWRVRVKDLLFMVSSLAVISLVTLGLLYRTKRLSAITSTSIDHFFDYTIRSKVVPRNHLESALLAHALSAFILTGLLLILWILFRPSKPALGPSNRDELLKAKVLLHKYSSSTEDFFKIWPEDKKFFFSKDGFITYKVSGPIAFALADPIAASQSGRSTLLKQFLRFARAKGWRVCFLPIAKDSLSLYRSSGLNIQSIGASAIIDTEKFINSTIKDKWWRWKTNRAKKSAYVFGSSQPPHSEQFLKQLRNVSDSWLQKPGRKERGFALGFYDDSYMQQCSVHYLTKDRRVVAFTNQLPIFAQANTATVDLLRHRPEDYDAMPYLLSKTIELLHNQSAYSHFDLGFVPFTASEDSAVKVIKALSTGRFSSRGLEQFKNKFDPEWHENFIAYDGDLADLALIALNLERVMQP